MRLSVTSAHVIEPQLAAAADRYINIGAYYDYDALDKKRAELSLLNKEYKSFYARAYKLIAGAEAVSSAVPVVIKDTDIVKTINRAKGIISREIKGSSKHRGKTTYRFLGAISCQGFIYYYETIAALAEKVYVLDNEFSLAHFIIEAAASAALDKGFDIIRCLDPVCPDITEHLIIPALSLAFVSTTSLHPYDGPSYRHLRLDTNLDKKEISASKNDIRAYRKLSSSIYSEAVKTLAEAKNLHDKLESVYHPHVDFDGVSELAEKYFELL